MMRADNKIIKSVDPRGFILNDNDTGVDHLDQSAYAEAIAESIHQVETPITIGLFARWGCGKSFLVKHILSTLKKIQKQGELDNAEVEENRVKTTKSFCSEPSFSKRWFFGIIMIILLAALLIFCMVITIQPNILLANEPVVDDIVTNVTIIPEEVTTVSLKVQHEHTATILRYVGIGLMIFVVVVAMFVTCCSQWISKSYYGQVKLLMYALFTKIPISKDKGEYIIGDPGEPDSSLLKRANPDEVVAAASVSNSVFPRKYIFVNFRAWEFAGSDRIWAGIVTNLASAIEAEFGIVTARLFRTTNFEQLSPTQMLKHEHRSKVINVDLAHILYMDEDGVLRKNEVKDAMKEYGVVRRCEKMEKRGNWWEIEFEEPAEARNAVDCLTIQGINVEREVEGDDSPKFDRRSKERESSRPLIGGDEGRVEEAIEAIEMQPLDAVPTPNLPYQQLKKPPEPEEREFSRQDGRCGRFCGHWSRHPTMLCCCPYLMWILLVFVIIVLLPLSIYLFADVLHLETARTFWGVSPYAQTLLWLPGGLSVVAFGLKFIWSMCNSQRSRVTRALNGTSSSMSTELGFMRKVKNEVAIMTKLIHCARFVFRRDYKVVISVDDVDRVALDKVKSVLEAVNILLSDRSSPFICLIAVDSRVAVKCIEQSLGEDLVKANVTGYEYLKKIINLPVCLPEVENISKRRFIAGLIDQADHTTNTRKGYEDGAKPKQKKKRLPRKSEHGDTFDGEASEESGDSEEAKEPTLDGKEFMFACREFIYNNNRLHRYLDGSPRNIKRIFNVISLTGCIIRQQLAQAKRRKLLDRMQHQQHQNTSKEHKFNNTLISKIGEIDCNETLVRDLVHWIVLTDQWAFRASYILQVIEDADQRVEAGNLIEDIPENTSLYEIYTLKVLPELYMSQSSLLSLDNDADLLVNYLLSIKGTGLNKARTKQMSSWTINLDRSIRQTIALQREMVVIQKAKNKAIL